jgi:surface polysaccharide O-acyltransferase-like enzyme
MNRSSRIVATGRDRELWVDNLRVVAIAGVIILHTATGYVLDFVGWYYDDERDASNVLSAVLTVPGLLGGLFWLGPLFLVAGWFSAGSLARRGPGGFVRARLLRLGLPLVVFVVGIQPLTDFLGNIRSERGTFAFYFGHTEVASMWFVAALLVFSIVYAVVRGLRPMPRIHRRSQRTTVALAIGMVAIASLAVWQWWPPLAEAFLNLKFAEWPQGAVLFALGVTAAEAGWTDNPPPLSRVHWLGWGAIAGAVALVGLLAIGLAAGANDLPGGLSWPTVAAAFLDGFISVAWTVWFVVWFRGRWPRHGALVGRAARGSYATYFTHPFVITAMMVLLAPIDLGVWPKFLLVAAAAVPACFAIGYGVTRLPWLSIVF